MRRSSRRVPIAIAAGTFAASLAGAVAAAEPSPAVVVPETLVLTPSQAEGPFYPVERPADSDADLTVVEGGAGVAAGMPLRLDGLVLTLDGQPLAGAIVEIWQTDANGVYLHPDDPGLAGRDEAFQGYGEASTDESGAWSFLTILPEVYGGRPRHIHAKVKLDGETLLTTQIYFSGGDIPPEGAVVLSGGDADALVTEALLSEDDDGAGRLRAQHLFVIPG